MKAVLVKMFVVLGASLLCASCNTMYGMGKDFEKVGDTMQNKAKGGIFGSKPASHDVPAYDDTSLLPPPQ